MVAVPLEEKSHKSVIAICIAPRSNAETSWRQSALGLEIGVAGSYRFGSCIVEVGALFSIIGTDFPEASMTIIT